MMATTTTKNIIKGYASDDNMSQGVYPSDKTIPSKEETKENARNPTLRTSGRNRKLPSPYEPYFEEKRYGSQLFGMNFEYKMTTTKNLNIIAVNTIFDQVFNTDPAQEAPG